MRYSTLTVFADTLYSKLYKLNFVELISIKSIQDFLRRNETNLDLIIEAGAHDGINSRKLKRAYPHSRLLLIEPDKYWETELIKVVGQNSLFAVGLSDKNEHSFLFDLIQDSSMGGARVREYHNFKYGHRR